MRARVLFGECALERAHACRCRSEYGPRTRVHARVHAHTGWKSTFRAGRNQGHAGPHDSKVAYIAIHALVDSSPDPCRRGLFTQSPALFEDSERTRSVSSGTPLDPFNPTQGVRNLRIQRLRYGLRQSNAGRQRMTATNTTAKITSKCVALAAALSAQRSARESKSSMRSLLTPSNVRADSSAPTCSPTARCIGGSPPHPARHRVSVDFCRACCSCATPPALILL